MQNNNEKQTQQEIPGPYLERAYGQEYMKTAMERAAFLHRLDHLEVLLHQHAETIRANKQEILDLKRHNDRLRNALQTELNKQPEPAAQTETGDMPMGNEA